MGLDFKNIDLVSNHVRDVHAFFALNRVADSIQIMDELGKSVFHNDSFINLFGYTVDQLNEAGGLYAILKDPQIANIIVNELEVKPGWMGKVQIYTLAGNLVSVVLRINKVKTEHRENQGYVCFFSNNLYQYNVYAEKGKYYRHFEEAEKLARLGYFSSVISHELNNPLNIINTKIYFLQRELESISKESEVWEHLTKIKQQLKRLKNLATSVLQYARHDVKKDYLVNVNQVIQRTLEFFDDQLTDDIVVVNRLDKSVSLVPADSTGLEIVFKNLISNAIEALEESGTITISTRNVNEKFIEITISDSGKGISEDLQEKVFDPFFTSKSKEGGYGLGLSICENIIHEHNGMINLRSRIGRGTTFVILLPRL